MSSTLKASQADQFMAELREYIDHGRMLIAQGRETELKDMGQKAAHLCESALNWSDDIKAQYAGQLNELMIELQVLAAELNARRDQIVSDLQGLSRSKQANVAYRTTEASDNYKNSEEE
jgi:ABC-type transporter Mla subunit MlaD